MGVKPSFLFMYNKKTYSFASLSLCCSKKGWEKYYLFNLKSYACLLYFITGSGEKCKNYVKFLFLHLVSMNAETLQCAYVSETGCLC